MKNIIIRCIPFLIATILFSLSIVNSKELDSIVSKEYELYIPQKTLSDKKRMAVLVSLPGWGISAKQDINNWKFPAGKNNFIVVCVNVNYAEIKSMNDVKYLCNKIDEIINSLAKKYPIDTRMTCIAGTSAGGMMSISLALIYPEKFVAIGVVSGGKIVRYPGMNIKNITGSQFYMIHGENDKIIALKELFLAKKELENNGASVEFKVIPCGEHTLNSGIYSEVVVWLANACLRRETYSKIKVIR